MADEEGEIRRMAEIADAINAILDAAPDGDALGDTPAQRPAQAQQAAAETPAAPASAAEETADSDVIAANDLDAAIAAEFSREGAGDTVLAQEAETEDPFGPVADLDLPGVNRAVGQNVKSGSEMADLSMRMQDTLAEIRLQANQSWAGADDLLSEMEAARAAMVADIRGQIQAIADATQQRRDTIMAELTELENQSMMARDEMEIMLVKFEASLGELQTRYFQNAEIEKERLGRYREFLQFLLDERGM